MKSERMKTGSVGVGCWWEREIVLGFTGRRIWIVRWKIQYYLVAVVVLQGKTTKRGGKGESK